MSCFLMILPNGLQYTLKRVGPKTDPCGTPYLTGLQQERELFTFTEVVRSTRYDRNHPNALSLTPMSLGLFDIVTDMLIPTRAGGGSLG